MSFVKGKSGNPNGRPKNRLADGRTLTDVAREHTEEAFNALLGILRNDEAPPAAVISAANSIIERGWGRPTQGVELTGKDGGAIQLEQKVQEDADAVLGALTRLTERTRAARVAGGTQH